MRKSVFFLPCLQVYKDKELYFYIDGYDVTKANWMRFVNPAYSEQAQNLIAAQHEVSNFFDTNSHLNS